MLSHNLLQCLFGCAGIKGLGVVLLPTYLTNYYM